MHRTEINWAQQILVGLSTVPERTLYVKDIVLDKTNTAPAYMDLPIQERRQLLNSYL